MAEEEAEMEAEGEGEEGGEEEEEEEPQLSPEEEKRARLMKEYMELIKQIEAQNDNVNKLKEKICAKCQKKCMTKCEEQEIQNLRCLLEKENLKLQCLLKKAMTLQEEDPKQQWGEIPIATTFEEDGMPIGLSYNMMRSVCKKSLSDEDGGTKPCGADQDDDDQGDKEDFAKYLSCLLKNASNKRGSKPKRPCPDDGGTMLEFDEDTIKQILCALQGQKSKGGKKSKKEYSKVCKELSRSYNMQEQLVQDNAHLEADRFKLQEEVLSRDQMIEGLQQKIHCMQADLKKLTREKEKLVKEICRDGGDVNPKTIAKVKKYKDCTKALAQNICSMQNSVERMKQEMDDMRKERGMQDDTCGDPCGFGGGNKRKTRSDEIEELKKCYANLLSDYSRKENELKELKNRMKGFVDPCAKSGGGGGSDLDKTEINLLKNKVSDLQEEQEEFKCLIKEQSTQMEDYRNKYLIAQQKVEEQKCIIEKLEMNNKRIEEQINIEIQRIKSKFQDKLKELAQLPKLLENEQLKLATACKEKEDLEQKLRLVCKELKALKVQMANMDTSGDDLPGKLKKCEHDYMVLQKKYDDLKADKDVLCEKLEKTQDDLDTLRTESARIIARTKERAENQRETMQNRIDKLEKQLAQCRATASLSISDREEVIKEMKGQLCTLSYSFDSAQKQIKTLKNHIAFLSNENSYPVKS